MKRFALVTCGILLCTLAAASIVSMTATPSWSGLDPTVSVSSPPIGMGCYERCDHQGLGGVCIPTENTWTCGIHPVNGCEVAKVCF